MPEIDNAPAMRVYPVTPPVPATEQVDQAAIARCIRVDEQGNLID